MKITRIWGGAAVLFVGALFFTAPVSADIASGAVLANTCYSCHGTDGKSAGDMPTIAGKSKKFITGKMKSFKAGKLEPTVMNRIAKGFTDSEIESLASHFAGK